VDHHLRQSKACPDDGHRHTHHECQVPVNQHKGSVLEPKTDRRDDNGRPAPACEGDEPGKCIATIEHLLSDSRTQPSRRGRHHPTLGMQHPRWNKARGNRRSRVQPAAQRLHSGERSARVLADLASLSSTSVSGVCSRWLSGASRRWSDPRCAESQRKPRDPAPGPCGVVHAAAPFGKGGRGGGAPHKRSLPARNVSRKDPSNLPTPHQPDRCCQCQHREGHIDARLDPLERPEAVPRLIAQIVVLHAVGLKTVREGLPAGAAFR
jgi:hypothetical protein